MSRARLIATSHRIRTLVIAGLTVACAYSLSSPIHAGGQSGRLYLGRPVADVLRELQTSDFQIIFSSELVPPSLVVTAEPTATTPRAIAEEILAPHGLGLRNGPRGRFLLVRLDLPPRTAPARRGPEPAAGTREPQKPSSVRPPLHIEERVEVVERQHDARTHASTYALEPRTIAETAGALDNVLHALESVPAVSATNDDDGLLAVRGAGPEHNLVVVDGVQIHNPRRVGEYTSAFLNPATASRIRLDASMLDAHHGGRLSSVTLLETRDGTRDRALAMTGSLSLTSGDVLVEGRLPGSASGSWWATARGTYYGALLERFTHDAVPGFADIQFKVTSRPTEKTRLTLFGLAGRETAREHDRVSEIGDLGSGGNGDGLIVPGAQYRGANVVGFGHLLWTPHGRLAATTTLSAYRHEARDHDASLQFAGVRPFERDVRVDDLAVRQTVAFAAADRHLLEGGFEVHRLASSWHMAGVRSADFTRGLGPSTWGEFIEDSGGAIETQLTRTHLGAWVQHRLPLGTMFAVDPAVRVDWNSFTGEASVQPRLRFSITGGRTVAWAGLSTTAQTPSHEALHGFDYFHLTPSDGARLRNEWSRQLVVGIDRRLGGGLHVRAEAYHRRFSRLLVQRLETDAERATRLSGFELPPDLPSDAVILERRPTMFPESIGEGRADGLELQVQHTGARLTGTLAYALSKAERDMYGTTFPFDFDRRHALYGTGVVRVSRRVRVALTWQGASGYPFTPVRDEVRFGHAIRPDGTVDPVARPHRLSNGILVTAPSVGMRRLSLRNSERLTNYSRTDVRVTYATLGHWEFYGEVLNLFDTHNFLEDIDTGSGAGRPGGGISQYPTYAYFQRLPSFGLRVRF